MRKEEAELKLKKYHAKLFSKRKNENPKQTIENDFDVFNILRMLSKGNTDIRVKGI